jgi:hypothetical protein
MKGTVAEGEEAVACEIEELAENSSFAEFSVAFQICSRVHVTRKERATLIFKLFLADYRADSLEAHRSY